jgi:hypothetical protein
MKKLIALVIVGVAVPALATTTSTNISNSLYDAAATSGARDLLIRTDEALNALTYTYYKTGSETWSDTKGIYETDCSGYADHMVEDAVPEAYDELRDSFGTTRPSAEHYERYFASITRGSSKGRWFRPAKLADLRPGDMLVWRYTVTQSSGATGHATIVASTPVRDTRWSNVYRLRVSDSARSGHSNDNRGSSGSGVGAGDMLVKVDSNGQPIEYAWSLSGTFHSDIKIALGRPRY